MKTHIEQDSNLNLQIEDNRRTIWIEQGDDRWIVIDRDSLPELIKILQSFVVMLLLSVSAYSQSGTFTLDTARTTSSQAWKFLGENNYLIKPSKPTHYFILSAKKEIIRAAMPDSLGIIKVWINRKEITWTSDSTFTYKTDQK
jgi:hypothetical protein